MTEKLEITLSGILDVWLHTVKLHVCVRNNILVSVTVELLSRGPSLFLPL